MMCTCAAIKIRSEVVARDWRAECEEHGTSSEWYKQHGSPYFRAYREWSITLQKMAGEARRTGIGGGKIPTPPRIEDF